MFRFIGLLLSFSILASASGQTEEELVTDRPDFTESGVVIPKGAVQIESGTTRTTFGSTTGFTGPEMLIRWSPTERFELRFNSPDFIIYDNKGSVGDVGIGFKYEIDLLDDWETAFIVGTSLPTGDDTAGSKRIQPSALFAAGRTVGELSLGTQGSIVLDGFSDKLLVGTTLVLGSSLSNSVSSFAEVVIDQLASGPASLLLHGGLTFSPALLVQLDVHFGAGVSDTAPDYLVGMGLSVRR